MGHHQADTPDPAASVSRVSPMRPAASAVDLVVNGLRARLDSAIPELVDELAAALAVTPEPARGEAHIGFVVRRKRGFRPAWRVLKDGEVAHEGAPAAVLGWLEWTIINAAVEHLDGWWRVHAGVVTRGDQAIVLTADSRTGKSTLVASLLRAGYRFLSDEVALIDTQGRVCPFIKSVCLRQGSWPLFEPPITTASAERMGEPVHFLDPRPWLADAVDGYRIGALVVLARDEQAKAPSLTPLRKSEALITLLRQTSASQQMGFDLVRRATDLLNVTPAYRLDLAADLNQCVTLLNEIARVPVPVIVGGR